MPDGSTVSGADEEAIWTAIKEWYEANPTVEEKPELNYPVEIIFEDGSAQMVANESEMETVKESCED